MAPDLNRQEFTEIVTAYPRIDLLNVLDIPWGRMTDAQFNQVVKNALDSIVKSSANTERTCQKRTDRYPTHQADGTWLRPLTWLAMSRSAGELFSHVYLDFMPEHWFSYLFFDAKSNKNKEEQKHFLEAADKVFIFDKITKGARLKPELNGLLRNAPAEDICNLLEATMECGFTRISMASQPPAWCESAVERNFSRLLDPKSKILPIKIGWRCETRGYQQVMNSGGLDRQVDSFARRRALHFDQPWHPFSRPRNTNCFWYRRANRDNDNFLVVSVAHSFDAALGFPKLGEDFSLAKGQKDITQWPTSLLADKKHNIGLVHFEDGSSQWKIVQRVNVFLFVLAGDFFDTARYQESHGHSGFPEWGVRKVDTSAIWGAIPVIKVFHGLSDDEGFTAIIDTAKAKSQIRRGDERNVIFNVATDRRMQDEYDSIISTPRRHLKWTSTGPCEINPQGSLVRMDNPVEEGTIVPKGFVKQMATAWERNTQQVRMDNPVKKEKIVPEGLVKQRIAEWERKTH